MQELIDQLNLINSFENLLKHINNFYYGDIFIDKLLNLFNTEEDKTEFNIESVKTYLLFTHLIKHIFKESTDFYCVTGGYSLIIETYRRLGQILLPFEIVVGCRNNYMIDIVIVIYSKNTPCKYITTKLDLKDLI